MRNQPRFSPFSAAERNASRCILFSGQGQLDRNSLLPAGLRRAAGLVSLLAVLASAVLVAATARAAGDEAPEWLRQAASSSFPSYDKTVPAVVLYDESTMNVDAD